MSKFNFSKRDPVYVDQNTLRPDQSHRLMDSDVFCMIPWVHLHGWPTGEAYPCCMADDRYPIGSMRESSLSELWNGDAMKTLRKNVLTETPAKECTKCYDQERNGLFSKRNNANKTYGQHIDEIDLTDETGYHPEFKIRHWDIRFSNICNFRCRSCGPSFSSNWFDDKKEQMGIKAIGHDKFIYAGKNKDDIWNQMVEHIPHLDQIYFAGGEPLLTEEHYKALNYMIEHGYTNVRLIYNTNFSEFTYKKQNVLDLWKHFDNVSVGASLDASGSRAEYMRKGTDWSKIVDNRIRLKEECPDVNFYISATVSNMNVMHVGDFHREWADLGYIKPADFSVNVVYNPSMYRADALPMKHKLIAKQKIEETIEWLKGKDDLDRATNGYRGLINFMMGKDNSRHLETFFTETRSLDKIRSEQFELAFPELSDLESEYRKTLDE